MIDLIGEKFRAVAMAWMTAAMLGTTSLSADPLPTEIVLARRLFAEARTAEEAKDWASAAAKLREAIAIKDTAGLRFHLAYCEEQQGLLVEALVDYERSEDLATGNEEFRAQLPAKLESLHRRIPTVTLLVPPEPKNPTLSVDGHPLPASLQGKPIPLNPGRHKLVLSAPDYRAFTTELSLNETDAVVANAVMQPIPKQKPVSPLAMGPIVTVAPPPPDHADRTGLSARTYVLIGEAAVGLGALALGIGYTFAAASQDQRKEQAYDQLEFLYPFPARPDAGCNNDNRAQNAKLCADLDDSVESARNDRWIARTAFIGAGVAAAGFVGTLILWRGPVKAAIIPTIGPDTARLSVAGHF